MNNNPKCPFKNKYMHSACNQPLLKNYNEWFCIKHGTVSFEREAWDPVEDPLDTYEAENGGQSWSQDEVAQLFSLFEEGASLIEISRILGRTKNAIYNKIWSERKQHGLSHLS